MHLAIASPGSMSLRTGLMPAVSKHCTTVAGSDFVSCCVSSPSTTLSPCSTRIVTLPEPNGKTTWRPQGSLVSGSRCWPSGPIEYVIVMPTSSYGGPPPHGSEASLPRLTQSSNSMPSVPPLICPRGTARSARIALPNLSRVCTRAEVCPAEMLLRSPYAYVIDLSATSVMVRIKGELAPVVPANMLSYCPARVTAYVSLPSELSVTVPVCGD
eukprot:30163_2